MHTGQLMGKKKGSFSSEGKGEPGLRWKRNSKSFSFPRTEIGHRYCRARPRVLRTLDKDEPGQARIYDSLSTMAETLKHSDLASWWALVWPGRNC